MLEYVTFTGADETVAPSALAALSEKYPFIEWGILLGSTEGSPRFPSMEWVRELVAERAKGGNKMHLSLHVCGDPLRGLALGDQSLPTKLLGPALTAFDRCQLNWHGRKWSDNTSERILAAFCNFVYWEPVIIFQLDGVNDHLSRGALRRFRCAGLFDQSHGAGILPNQWPQPLDYMQSGYAGGLGPDNLAEQLPRILEVAGEPSIWIDMETKIRDDVLADTFNLKKVEACCEIAKHHVLVR